MGPKSQKGSILSRDGLAATFCKKYVHSASEAELKDFEPDFTIVNACSEVNEKWQEHGLHSDMRGSQHREKPPSSLERGTGEKQKGRVQSHELLVADGRCHDHALFCQRWQKR